MIANKKIYLKRKPEPDALSTTESFMKVKSPQNTSQWCFITQKKDGARGEEKIKPWKHEKAVSFIEIRAFNHHRATAWQRLEAGKTG